MASQRIEPLPDLPTVSESGFKDFETDVWFGLAGAGEDTERDGSRSSSIGLETALLAPEVKTKLIAQALYPNPKCGADFEGPHIRLQSELFTRLIRELNIKTE